MEEMSLSLGLSAGVMYIVQRFLQQLAENVDSNDDEEVQRGDDVFELDLEIDDDNDNIVPSLMGDGDLPPSEPELPQVAQRKPNYKRWRNRRIKSQRPGLRYSISRPLSGTDLQVSERTCRSRSPHHPRKRSRSR